MIAKMPKPRPSNAMMWKATSKFTTSATIIKIKASLETIFLTILIHIPFIIFACIEDLI